MSAQADRLPTHHAPEPWSRPLRVDDVPEDGMDLTIEAEPADFAAIARQVGLPSIGALAGRFHIERRPGGRLHVEGEVRAMVTQVCVVSLESFEAEIEQPIDLDFAPRKAATVDRGGRPVEPGASRRRRVGEPAAPPPEPDEDDPPDPIVEGRIDLGAVAVEFLTLGLDPYPKKHGVRFETTVVGDTGDPEPSAFAALGRLKDRS